MKRFFVMSATVAALGCASGGAQDVGAQDVSGNDLLRFELEGVEAQGGLLRGRTEAGTVVTLDGSDVAVDDRGRFLIGFGRDNSSEAILALRYPDGTTEERRISVAPRPWKESRITVAESKANPYKPEDIAHIERSSALKNAARSSWAEEVYWTDGFVWPADGCISSRFGSRRIINGEPRRYHSGVDVAAPDGMSPMDYIGEEIRSPAAGIVTLAEPDMFFEGGLVFIDHGQHLETAMMHMSEVSVRAGERVAAGQPVGRVGMTGRVTGPHLHWSLKLRDTLLDPESVVANKPACTD